MKSKLTDSTVLLNPGQAGAAADSVYYTETHGPTAIRTVWQQIPWLKIPDGVMKRSPLIDKGDHHALRSAIEAFMDYWGFTPKQRQEWEQTHWKDVYNGKTSKGATVHPYTMFLANLFRYSTFAWLQQDPTNRPNELERLWPSVDKAIDDVTQALKGPARILAKCYGGHEIKAYVEGVLYLTDRLKQNPNVTHEEVWEVVRETKDLIHAKEEDASMDSLTSKEGMGPFERVMREAASDKQGRKRKFEAGGEMVAEPDAMTRFKAYCDYKKANPTKSDRNTCRILAAREVAQIEDKMARQRESELVDARAKRIRDAISAIKKQRRESGQPPLI